MSSKIPKLSKMTRNLIAILLLIATFLQADAGRKDASSRLGFWTPLPALPVVGVGTGTVGTVGTCPVCNEAACCSFMCQNGFLCTVTAGKSPECLFAPDPTVAPVFRTSAACKRVNCDSCTAAQISCSALTKVCESTTTENVCQFNY